MDNKIQSTMDGHILRDTKPRKHSYAVVGITKPECGGNYRLPMVSNFKTAFEQALIVRNYDNVAEVIIIAQQIYDLADLLPKQMGNVDEWVEMGKRLRQERDRLGISKSQFRVKCGMAPERLDLIENGLTPFTPLDQYLLTANGFDVGFIRTGKKSA